MRTFQRMTTDLWLCGYVGPTCVTGERIEVLKYADGDWSVMVGRDTTWHSLANMVPYQQAIRVAHDYHRKCVLNFGLRAP